MALQIKQEADGSYTATINFRMEGSMLSMEEEIARMVNEVGLAATVEALKKLDSQGQPLARNNEKHTSRGQEKKVTKRRTAKRE